MAKKVAGTNEFRVTADQLKNKDGKPFVLALNSRFKLRVEGKQKKHQQVFEDHEETCSNENGDFKIHGAGKVYQQAYESRECAYKCPAQWKPWPKNPTSECAPARRRPRRVSDRRPPPPCIGLSRTPHLAVPSNQPPSPMLLRCVACAAEYSYVPWRLCPLPRKKAAEDGGSRRRLRRLTSSTHRQGGVIQCSRGRRSGPAVRAVRPSGTSTARARRRRCRSGSRTGRARRRPATTTRTTAAGACLSRARDAARRGCHAVARLRSGCSEGGMSHAQTWARPPTTCVFWGMR